MSFRHFFLVLLLVSIGSASEAALAKFDVRNTVVTVNDNVSPNPLITFGEGGAGTAVVDDAGGSGSPILMKLVLSAGLGGSGLTISAPSLSGFIWIKSKVVDRTDAEQTGTGSVTSTIEWGDTTGWTTTGGQFCNGVPSTLCELAMRSDDATVAPVLVSTHYDLESWTFHGTGFVGDPYIFFTNTSGDLGNSQRILRGRRAGGGEVPAVPLVAMGAAAVGVLAMAVLRLRQR